MEEERRSKGKGKGGMGSAGVRYSYGMFLCE